MYLQANASAADPNPHMLLIDVAGLISTMTTNMMLFMPRGAVVLRVNQSLDTQTTHVMHATHAPRCRGSLGKFTPLRLHSHRNTHLLQHITYMATGPED